MTRRKLTTLIVAGVFAAALLGMALLKTNESAAPQDPAATTQDAERPADTTPEQIQQAPRSSQDVFMPPPTDATGSSAIAQHLVENFQLTEPLKNEVAKLTKLAQLSTYLTAAGMRQGQEFKAAQTAANQLTVEAHNAAALKSAKTLAESEQAKALRAKRA